MEINNRLLGGTLFFEHTLKSCYPNAYELILRFEQYVQDYHEKLEAIYNFLKSISDEFEGDSPKADNDARNFLASPVISNSLFELKKELKELSNGILLSKDTHSLERFIDQAFPNTNGQLKIKEIIRLVCHYITKQDECLTALYSKGVTSENSFGQWLRQFMNYIEEEASILFCNVVKDSFQFMDAPEKQVLSRLNRQFLQRFHSKPDNFNDDLEKMEKEIETIVSLAADANESIKEILLLIKKMTGIRCIQFLVLNPFTKELVVKFYSYVEHLPMYDVAHDNGIIAESAMRKEAINIPSVYNDSRYDIFDATIKSELAVPVLTRGEVYGTAR